MNYSPMNPHVKRKWVRALRSGRYKKTIGRLWRPHTGPRYGTYGPRVSAGYCCLGVLVAECRPASVEGWGSKDVIPDDMAVVWGLDCAAQNRLVTFNDDRHWSFLRIANWIDQNL